MTPSMLIRGLAKRAALIGLAMLLLSLVGWNALTADTFMFAFLTILALTISGPALAVNFEEHLGDGVDFSSLAARFRRDMIGMVALYVVFDVGVAIYALLERGASSVWSSVVVSGWMEGIFLVGLAWQLRRVARAAGAT